MNESYRYKGGSLRRSCWWRLERALNVAILAMMVLAIGMYGKSYLWPALPAIEGPQRGTKIEVEGVQPTARGKTLLIALSTDCHFCTDSAPLYRRLAGLNRGTMLRKLVAIFPQSAAEGRTYLVRLGITGVEVAAGNLVSTGISATPTLVILGEGGTVEHSWAGKLSSKQERELIAELFR